MVILFLLGLNASENGSGTFSNVYASLDIFGLVNREYRVWEAAAFAQDATQGRHLQRLRSLNQALEASPENPVRGVTSDTLANIPLRVPVPGIAADSLREAETEGTNFSLRTLSPRRLIPTALI